MHLLFIHGTGLNTEPDRRALREPLARAGITADFWNEPSARRPAGTAFRREAAFQATREDLSCRVQACPAPVTLVGMSSGALTVAWLVADRVLRPRISDVVLIAPVLDLVRSHRAIMELSRSDFEQSAPEKARRLDDLLRHARAPYDVHFQEGLALAAENPKLLSRYFASEAALRFWADVMSEAEWGIDLDAFDAVLRQIAAGPLVPAEATGLACRAIFGDLDPVAHAEWVRPHLDRVFPGWKCHVVRGTGHWPHIERPDELIRVLASPA